MTTWVYARRRNAQAADAFAETLRRNGDRVRRSNSKFYEGEVHEGAEVVYHDGLVPEIQRNHDAAGVRCERWTGSADTATDAAPDAPDDGGNGHHIEKSGSWYKLIGPDGEQVGKSQRSLRDAWELLGDGD